MSNENILNNKKNLLTEKNNVIMTDLQYLEQASEEQAVTNIRKFMQNKMKILPGHKVLDVDCGLGKEVLNIAKLVGSSGLVVGIDANEEAITKITNNLALETTNIKFIVQNAENITYSDNFFDSSRSERVFQHLKNPDKVLDEMIRVTKSGGTIAIVDPDWDSLMITSDNKSITRKVVSKDSDLKLNGSMGIKLVPMFKKHNLKDIEAEPYVIQTDNFNLASLYLDLERAVKSLASENKITNEEATSWVNELKEKDKRGLFYCAMVVFIVSGKK